VWGLLVEGGWGLVDGVGVGGGGVGWWWWGARDAYVRHGCRPPLRVCVRLGFSGTRLVGTTFFFSVHQNLILDSEAGSDQMPFRIKEIYGWTAPVVGRRNYQFRFNSLVDWRNARIRCVDVCSLPRSQSAPSPPPLPTPRHLDYGCVPAVGGPGSLATPSPPPPPFSATHTQSRGM
jgi:hypothetical protein